MEALLKSRILRIRKIEKYLVAHNVKISQNKKENKELFLNHFLSKNKMRIKRRARIRRKLMRC